MRRLFLILTAIVWSTAAFADPNDNELTNEHSAIDGIIKDVEEGKIDGVDAQRQIDAIVRETNARAEHREQATERPSRADG